MATDLLNCFSKVDQELKLNVGLIPVLDEKRCLRTDDPDGQAGTRKRVSTHQTLRQTEVSPKFPNLIFVEVLEGLDHTTLRQEKVAPSQTSVH